MKKNALKIALIGSGNVATSLAQALNLQDYCIKQIYGRNRESTVQLAKLVNADPITAWKELNEDLSVIFICVSDEAIPLVITELPKDLKALVLHTSGSTPISVFEKSGLRQGVFYPVQTFSKAKPILQFDEVPLAIETTDPADYPILEEIATSLSRKVFACDSSQRMAIHIAAVFACNFSNHLYSIAASILKKQGFNFDLIHPLIQETTQKAIKFDPSTVQTGPAARHDWNILSKHQSFLSQSDRFDPNLEKLYTLISDLISKPH